MHAVTSLLTGIRGAEGGYARLFARGTTTRATWYTTFEGDSANSSGDDIALDENGGVEAYVDQLVDVVVLDSDGAEVRRFTDGYSAGSIEVRSQSFTGTDYDDASTGRGSNYPLTLQAVLDLWKTKTGTYDWDVLLGGSITTLVGALGIVAGPLVYNVKSATYGATGDGVADDTTAIAAAITAATSAGGIVFFPPGTYHITTGLSVPAKVSLIGCGSTVSIISKSAAAGVGVTFTGAGSYAKQWMVGLRVQSESGTTNAQVAVNDGGRVAIHLCELGGANDNGEAVTLMTSTTTDVLIADSVLRTAGTAFPALLYETDVLRCVVERCRLVASNVAWASAVGLVSAKTIKMVDCIFDASAVQSGTRNYFMASSTTLNARFRGCTFLNGGGTTVMTALALGSYTATSAFEESDSFFGTTVTAYSYDSVHAGNSKGAQVRLRSRDGRRYETTDNSATVTGLPLDQYGLIVVKRTTNADQVIELLNFAGTNTPPDGSRAKVVVWNASGGAIASERFDRSNLIVTASHTTLGSQQCAVLEFETVMIDGTTAAIAATSISDEQSFFA